MKRETKSKPVMVRMTPSEKKAAEAKAAAKGLTLSAWLRMLAVTAAAAVLLVGCGPGAEPEHLRSEGMWSSAHGVLSCPGSSPQPAPDPDHLVCEWSCVSVDGSLYSEVLLGFTRSDGATEWYLESQFFVLDGTPGYGDCGAH